MAKLGEECRIHSICLSKFYKLPVSYGQGVFMINVGRTAVSSIQVHDQKLLQTWTLKHPFSFTCPVVFIEAESTLCCVVNNNILMLWSCNSDNLDDAEKLKVKETIFALIPVEGQKPVVVFCKGGCYAFDHITANPDNSVEQFLNSDEDIIWSESAVRNSEVLIFYLTLKKTINEYKCHCFSFANNDHIAFHVNCWTISRDSESLRGWCLCNNSSSLDFITVWSDGEVHSYTAEGHQSKLFTIADMQHYKFAAVDVIDDSHLAVIRQSSTKDKREAVLDIWDIKYSVRKIRKVLKTLLSPNLQMKILQSTIFLPSNEDIVTISVHVEASTLAAAIGKLVSSPETPKRADYHWTSDGKLESEPFQEIEDSQFSHNLGATKRSIQSLLEEKMPDISTKEMKSLCCYLTQLKDVPESELVKMLQFALNKKIFNSENEIEEESKLYNKKKLFLNTVFLVSYSDVFLQQHLKKLTFKETISSLEYLSTLLGEELMMKKTGERPTDLQIVNWIQLLIQSHFEEFLLSRDKKILNLLNKMYRCISEKLDIYSELEQIEHLWMLQKKNILPENTIQGKYCIETLHL